MNILLILGVSSLFAPLGVKTNTVHKEIPITILISSLLMVLAFDNMYDSSVTNVISRTDGIVILLFFSVFLYYLFSIMRNRDKDEETNPKYKILPSLGLLILGLAGIIFGSDFVVDNASSIAKVLGVSDKMISLTVVALGTSLPELVTSVQAARKGENDIAIGNVIGSNIFNIGFVIGIPATFIGAVNASGFNYIDMLTMIISAVLLFILTIKNEKIERREGIVMLLVFASYYTYVILGGI